MASDDIKILLKKEYSGESIVDVFRDVEGVIENSDVPVGEYGFAKGTYTITLTWNDL